MNHLGIHVSKQSKISLSKTSRPLQKAIKDDVIDNGFGVCQIFTHGPRNTKKNDLSVEKITDTCSKGQVTLVIHSSYATDSVWFDKRIVGHLKDQIKTADELNAYGIVVHLVSGITDETIVTVLSSLPEHKALILLEPDSFSQYNDAKQISSLCSSLKDVSGWGMCLDTAHLYSYGQKISSYDEMKLWLENMANVDRIKLIHLNGGVKCKKFPCQDQHRAIFSREDAIYRQHIKLAKTKLSVKRLRQSGAWFLMAIAKEKDIPIVFELNDIKSKMNQEKSEKALGSIRFSLSVVKNITKKM